MRTEKDNLIMEVAKLLSVLNSWVNVLVPSIEGEKETFAKDKLKYLVNKLGTDYSLTVGQIEEHILLLQKQYDD